MVKHTHIKWFYCSGTQVSGISFIKIASSSIQLNGNISCRQSIQYQVSACCRYSAWSSSFRLIHLIWYTKRQIQQLICLAWDSTCLLHTGQLAISNKKGTFLVPVLQRVTWIYDRKVAFIWKCSSSAKWTGIQSNVLTPCEQLVQ